jgi:hypothetical protein
MKSLVLAAVLASSSASPAAAAAVEKNRWPAVVERLMAADAAALAPPDLKRQLANHRDRLMKGVDDARAAENPERDFLARRAAAARAAIQIAAAIRSHQAFREIAYAIGGLVHELAEGMLRSGGPGALDPAAARETAKTAFFLGYSQSPFDAPERLLAFTLPTSSPRAAYDTAVTASTRLLAAIWKDAGGDASIVTKYPESEGPYVIRE